MRETGILWKNMTEKEKSPFIDDYEKEKVLYNNELAAYELKFGRYQKPEKPLDKRFKKNR